MIAALGAATFRAVELQEWQEAASRVGGTWAHQSGARLVKTRFEGEKLVLLVQGPNNEDQDANLLHLLHGAVPDGTPVAVDRVAGSINNVGDVTAPPPN